MRTAHLLLIVFLLPGMVFAQSRRELKGEVVIVGKHQGLVPVPNTEVLHKLSGNKDRTNSDGFFRLFLPDRFKAGEKIALTVRKDGYEIHQPLNGEFRIPADLDKDLVQIRLLPLGSREFLSLIHI